MVRFSAMQKFYQIFFDTVGANVWYGDSFVPYHQNFSLSHYSKTRFLIVAHNRERITMHLEIDSKSVSELFLKLDTP